jgi:hypothetical protein
VNSSASVHTAVDLQAEADELAGLEAVKERPAPGPGSMVTVVKSSWRSTVGDASPDLPAPNSGLNRPA